MSHQARWVGPVFRWAIWLDQWAMPDVFLLGAFVGYSRVEANLDVKIGPGGYCFMAAAFLAMISRAVLDERTAWRAIGASPALTDPESHELNRELISCTTCDLVLPVEAEGQRCPRCRARLWARKRDSIVRTSALLIAAFILYWPANLYPMSKSLQFGETMSHRIIDGIRELFQAGLAPLGVLIFITSIAIPVLKIAGLGWCVISVQRGSSTHLVEKTKFYRVIDEVGRWSNMDPFTIAVFVPLMQFNNLISARAAPGAGAFILVVVLTMFASQSFDPRLMWDAAERAI
jgi:paraquat-inducible protein A